MAANTIRKRGNPSDFSLKSFLFKAVTAILVTGALFFISNLNKAEFFPISHVKIYGAQRINKQDIQTMVEPLVDHGFFAVNVERIKESILQMPWVSQVAVHRTWPSEVTINITEKNPLALWNDNSILSASGELFAPPQSTYPNSLPQFVGSEGEQLMMSDYYAKMSLVLAPLHFKMTRLEFTPARTWTLTLDNGMKLTIGNKDVLTRLDHFVKVYPKIVGNRAADVEYIDLRYPNGMAVRWKSNT